MKVLITGANGQLGRALLSTAPKGVGVIRLDRSGLDMTDAHAISRAVVTHDPHLIINCAAYTGVDKAETEETLAHQVNGQAVAHLRQACDGTGAKIVQISTDFVFDGGQALPYKPDDAAAPLSVYGRTKLAGERAVAHNDLVVRTSWVHAAEGTNFVRTMLRLMQEREHLGIVADQIGTPTFATDLAFAIWQLVEQSAIGVFHYTNSGVASWYDFAVAIMEEGIALGLLDRAIEIKPIRTVDYPTPAQRPAFSVLDKSATWEAIGKPAPHWRDGLRRMLIEVRDNG